MDAPAKRRWPVVTAAVLGALVLLVAIGLFVLDSVLTSKAHDEAAKLSQQLGRPVTIGSVSTKVLTGFGVAVKEVGIGPAAGEGLPLAQVKRADVRIALLRAIWTGGQDVLVPSAAADGVNVNLIRFGARAPHLARLHKKLSPSPPQ